MNPIKNNVSYLTGVTDGTGTISFAYDAVSNRIRKTVTVTGDINVLADVSEEEVELTEGTTNYTYNELNQLVKEERGDTVTPIPMMITEIS